MILTKQILKDSDEYRMSSTRDAIIHYPKHGCQMIDGSGCWILKPLDAIEVVKVQYRLYGDEERNDFVVVRVTDVDHDISDMDEFVDSIPIAYCSGSVRWDVSAMRRKFEDRIRKDLACRCRNRALSRMYRAN